MDVQLNTLKKGFFIIFAAYMLIGMHYFQHNGGGAGLHLPFNVVGWMFITPLIAIGLWQATIAKKLHYTSLTLIFISATAIMLVPLIYANSVVASGSYTRLLGLVAGLLFFISLQQLEFNQQQRLNLLYLILAAVFIEACFSLVQYYLLPVNNWVGYQKLANRPYGIFQQPNVAASFLTTGIALAIYLLSHTTASEKKKRLFCYITTFAAAIPVILLQSRTGYISLILVPLLLLPWAYQQLRERGQVKIAIFWLACFIIASALGILTLETADKVARSAAALTDPGARIPIYLHSLNMFLDKPFIGWGYGSFESTYLQTYSEARQQGLALPGSAENLDHPHNELLFWGIEGGILALSGIALLIISFFRVLTKQPILQSIAFCGLLFPIILHTQTEYPFYHSVVHWCIFLMLVWYIDSRCNIGKSINLHYTFLLRACALLIPVISIAFMATTLHTNALLTKYERSDRTDITPLTKVINPMAWITRLEFNSMIYRLKIALRSNNVNELNAYITWAEDISQRTPRSNIYLTWAQALEKLKKKQEALALLRKAQIRYPNNPVIPRYIAYLVAKK